MEKVILISACCLLIIIAMVILCPLVVFKLQQNKFVYRYHKTKKELNNDTMPYKMQKDVLAKGVFDLDTLELEVANGMKIRGFFIKGKERQNKRLMLFMHGTGTYIPNKLDFMQNACQNLGIDIIAFNYRGFGISDGREPDELEI